MSSVSVYGASGQAVGRIVSPRRAAKPGRLRSSRMRVTPMTLRRYYLNGRGLYRIFNSACYRFYRSNSAPPAEGSTPFATNATLPYTPTDTFADGTWYLSVSWFNGVLDSGFIPVGPGGETYIKLVVSSGEEITEPPSAPIEWRLSQSAGVVSVAGLYHDADARRADQWALAYTLNGSDPAADTPDATVEMAAYGAAMLNYDLAAQAHGTVVKVLLQTRRNDGTVAVPVWRYSTSEIKSITVDAQGPDAPEGLAAWAGSLGLS